MRYLKFILLSLLVGCAVDLAMVVLMQAQRTEQMPPHGCDMSGMAYGFAVAFNLLLAIASCPVFLNAAPGVRASGWRSGLSFFLLPLAVCAYSSAALDIIAGVFCLPYLLTFLYFFIRFRKTVAASLLKYNTGEQ